MGRLTCLDVGISELAGTGLTPADALEVLPCKEVIHQVVSTVPPSSGNDRVEMYIDLTEREPEGQGELTLTLRTVSCVSRGSESPPEPSTVVD